MSRFAIVWIDGYVSDRKMWTPDIPLSLNHAATLDAIKKIILEFEQGKSAKVAVIQNRKLRREVTTISRMTHNNIVRYYQAWVEGGGREADVIEEEDDNHEDLPDAGDVLASQDALSDDENDEPGGWWMNSPDERDLTLEMQKSSSSSTSNASSDNDESTSSWSHTEPHRIETKDKDENSTTHELKRRSDKYKRTTSSLSELLEHENDHGFGVS